MINESFLTNLYRTLFKTKFSTMFNIGQQVVCINPHISGKIEVGKIYTIRSFWNCCHVNLDIGLMCCLGNDGTYCSKCGERTYDCIHYFNSKYFAPLEEWQQADEAIKELMAEINQPVKI